MSNLASLQAAFQKSLISGDPVVPPDILDGPRESADVLFGIYRHAYWVRLVDALGNDFPGLKALLGDDEFENLARAYIRDHPSKYRSIRWLGSGFADYAAGHAAFRIDPWIADMARLDWAFAHAFDAVDLTPVRLDDVKAVPAEFWGSLRLEFHPSLTLIGVSTPVADVRVNLLSERPTSVDRTVRQSATIMVWRYELGLKFRELQVDEARAQKLMAEGGDISAMCESLAAANPDGATERAAEILMTWLEWGAIGNFSHEMVSST